MSGSAAAGVADARRARFSVLPVNVSPLVLGRDRLGLGMLLRA